MKNLIYILLFIHFALFGQEAPKKATSIVLKDTTLSVDNHFKATLKTLLKEGYKFENANLATELIITEPKEIAFGFMKAEKATVKLTLEYNITDSSYSVIISGLVITKMMTTTVENKITNKGMKGSSAKETWNEMQRIGTLIPSTSTSYLIE